MKIHHQNHRISQQKYVYLHRINIIRDKMETKPLNKIIKWNMNKQQLANKIWASANKMRSKIDANEYKDYILGLIFYKFLSDNEVNYMLKDMKGRIIPFELVQQVKFQADLDAITALQSRVEAIASEVEEVRDSFTEEELEALSK